MSEGRVFYAEPNETKVCRPSFYQPIPSNHVRVSQGLYRSRFVLGPLYLHLKMTRGATDVPNIFARSGYEHPYAAIGLAAAAVCPSSTTSHVTMIDPVRRPTVLQLCGGMARYLTTNMACQSSCRRHARRKTRSLMRKKPFMISTSAEPRCNALLRLANSFPASW